MSEQQSDLFPEFPPVSREAWEEVIKGDLKGADYTDKLRWKSGEGVAPLPFYRREDLPREGPQTVDNRPGWSLVEEIYEQDPAEANDAARRALSRGAEALRFHLRLETLDGMLGGDQSGLALRGQDDMDRLLEEIDPRKTPLHFDAAIASPAVLAMVRNTLDRRGTDLKAARLTLLHDPVSWALEHGRLPMEGEAPHRSSAALLEAAEQWGLDRLRCLGVDARIYHRAGASAAQELGWGVAAAGEYLAHLGEEGLAPGAVAPRIHFCLSAGSAYFIEMAKFRALRLLWHNLCRAWDIDQPPHAFLTAETSSWNKTLYDPHTNMLRTTTEGMSAALAGADALVVQPYDESIGRPDDFSRRIARNSQIIMKEEAYLDRVADPSAGSYYIEHLTEELAERAWEHFREVEAQGGLLKAVEGGFLQAAAGESREERDRAVAFGKRVFVGTNHYPDPDGEAGERAAGRGHRTVSVAPSEEAPKPDPDRLVPSMAECLLEGAGMGDLATSLLDAGRQKIAPLRPYRGAEAFEELRLATEAAGRAPSVLTLPLGDRRMRKARSSFAVNLLGCAGYEIEDPIGFESADEAVEAVRDAAPDVAVLCSSDEAYAELLPAVAGELRALENPPLLVLAGRPETVPDPDLADLFIHARSNVLQTLRECHRRLGIAP
ncbi:MAG: methylmalonyl-CoA mutase family protein [Balneolaceae bacterium]|nr:methylmalonyl-CoA mutase family protein [Balneolaceae bacterium]